MLKDQGRVFVVSDMRKKVRLRTCSRADAEAMVAAHPRWKMADICFWCERSECRMTLEVPRDYPWAGFSDARTKDECPARKAQRETDKGMGNLGIGEGEFNAMLKRYKQDKAKTEAE